MNAALEAHRADGSRLEVHLSTHLPGDVWVVELPKPTPNGTVLFLEGSAGETLTLPGAGSITLDAPYPGPAKLARSSLNRLWAARLRLPSPLDKYLQRYGFPIRYDYVHERWSLSYYQNVYATETGSAEMPSAGRPFTPEVITRLVAQGIQFAPLVLHSGVASLETNEPPYEEFYRVPEDTARILNSARWLRKQIIVVGTTVVRALETATDVEGTTWAGEGWTDLVVTPRRGIRAVNGLLTGFHEPRSTHLAMLEALVGREHLEIAYAAALDEGYLWHEFGDLHLILP
jgi:S-adenosylmethionine:tRNA ribosyltransferase-isomerase